MMRELSTVQRLRNRTLSAKKWKIREHRSNRCRAANGSAAPDHGAPAAHEARYVQ